MLERLRLQIQVEILRRGGLHPLILTTCFSEAVRDQAMAGGALAFLTKPIDPNCLLDAIEAAVH